MLGGDGGEPTTDRSAGSQRVAALLAALAAEPGGLTGPELLVELRRRWPNLSEPQLRRLIASAGASVGTAGDRFLAAQPVAAVGPAAMGTTLRAVAYDLEALPRLTSVAPYVERAVWQIGAVRFGRDSAWVSANQRMVAWVELPAGYELPDAAVAARHRAAARPPASVYGQLSAFCAGADALVAYNGTGLDFGALDGACDRAGVRRIDEPERVDALYLAYTWWPMAAGHRLHDLAARVGVELSGLRWHDAADDAEALARLVVHGATTITGAWSNEFASLIASVASKSPAWRLAFDLAIPARGEPPQAVALDDIAVATTLENALVTPPVRPGTTPPAIAAPAAWRDPGGQVDPYLLSSAINPGTQRRAAQGQMAAEIRARFPKGPDLAIEAPTGTGKSLAALAAAVDWLGGGTDRRVVIATHTKHLQAQLAADVEALAAIVPDLLRATSLVKGATNRLSMRALVSVCADVTAPIGGGGRPSGVLTERRFGEMVVFLLARLAAGPTSMLGAHEARSVDTADVPAFFDDYSDGRWGAYLAVLSQAAAGDFNHAAGLGAHTRLVAEHLAAYRLIIANHALVFAHLDDLSALGPKTLLIVDEAHTAEGSATEAFSSTFSYQRAERVSQLLSAWARRPDATPTLIARARNLEGILETERPARTAMVAVDRASGVAAGDHGRSATLASPFVGDSGAGATRAFLGELGKIARACTGAARALAGWYAQNAASLSRPERDRHGELAARLAEVAAGASGVTGDVDTLLGTTYLLPPAPARGGAARADGRDVNVVPGWAGGQPAMPTPVDDLEADHGGGDDDSDPNAVADDAEDDQPGDTSGADAGGGEAGSEADGDLGDGYGNGDDSGQPAGAPAGNRVVWIAEQPGSDLAGGTRRYRFEVRSSPIRLPADHDWARFRSVFARTVFTSATLTVAGGWDYLLDRLGIRDCDTISLAGPFDYARQARLVCFADFPSWSEQTEAAMRTVAHQLAGYARETITAGHEPGAIVLTTSTAAAAGIAEHLAAYTARAGLDVPLAAAPIVGNRRAVERFRADGGWLVGTKGLWAGVDVPEPNRARLVWINKLPFAPFADPLVAARRADAAARAAAEGHPDPDAAATERYYLPLAAVELRQAAGRLLRSAAHRGVIVISDRKLAGAASARRQYRRILLGSLDPGLLVADSVTGEQAGGNVVTTTEGWVRIWEFLAAGADIDPGRLPHLVAPAALDEQALLAETRAIRDLELTATEVAAHTAAGTLADEVVKRSRAVGGLLRFADGPLTLKPEQADAIRAAAEGRDLLALLPTGFGKSYCFQLPALILPGLTIVVSPLVALMADQALELNRAIGGAVRALVSPLRESSSRAGRQEVAEQLTGVADHRIKLVYISPERFAHRQFREWVRAGVAARRVNRIVFDEAHTLVQWGDDFRPAYRRLTTALGDLRTAGPQGRLPVSALTATANRTVREGLRTVLFGLPSSVDPATGDPGWFTWIQANPVRPELAVYKVQLAAAGPVSVARYVESVFDALDGHAVFYCLTVREVDAMWAHLIDYVGPAGATRIRRFHGRLPEAEKASVLADFRDAPYAGEEGFAPMVVVATSAFGLGINRGDVRCVFVTSPPTDLAALYQQLGRAGRDATGTIPGDKDKANVGIALATGRGFRTVEFLTRDLPPAVLEAAGRQVLGCLGGVLNASAAGDRLIAAELAAGRISVDIANRDATRDRYRTAVVRALAALADAGAVDDLGDLPETLRLTPGETPLPTGLEPDAVFAREARAWVDADPLRSQRASVLELHAALTAAGAATADDPPATWAQLVELHHAGVLDVSAAPSRAWLTGVRVRSRTLPTDYTDAVGARARRAGAELAALRAWYADTATCANQGVADYLAAVPPGTMPAGTCSTAACRCSSCWGRDGTGISPSLLDAVMHLAPRPASGADDRLRRARLDQAIDRLLYDNPVGLGPPMIRRCLRGEETYFHVATRQRRPLRPALLYHRLFGSRPGLREDAVRDSLTRLEAAGLIVADGSRWRSAARVEAAVAAAARAGTAAGPAVPPARAGSSTR
jgi:RecQ family ATP-dependent DNA helicase